ncbi:MAG: TetR/AcrR family transcriptional regulator [Actinomycetota bacterium]|nr:TetR/AcrR family transcriptional regulator [Actinomycetota bacterium]MDQ6949933.1 TetR/AcrR family transcriptional regulator [Actinomycetota bacterium]
MARPRSFDRQQALVAAKEVFWQQGYERTAISDVEEATGLSRSSLYLAFETKQRLFEAALEEYRRSFIDIMVARVESDGAGLREAAEFFTALAAHFRDAASQRGCLQINSITELAGRGPIVDLQGARFVDRFRRAFSKALLNAAAHGEMDEREAVRRAELLSAAALGAWVAVRTDHHAAAKTCRAIASEIKTWAASERAAPDRQRRATR